MAELLFEILAEEIPAGVLPAAREDLLARVTAAFAEARLGGTLAVHSTSRRLVLVGRGHRRPPERRRIRSHRPAGFGRLRRRRQPDEGRCGLREGARSRRGGPPGRVAAEGRLPRRAQGDARASCERGDRRDPPAARREDDVPAHDALGRRDATVDPAGPLRARALRRARRFR